MERCYMCEQAATSREHVPPRCLFPESKDMGGAQYRENLITVPSCDVHNMAKSRDDEFLMVSLAGIIGNNSIGYRHKFGKVNKAIRRSANRLLDSVFAKKQHVFVIEVRPNKFIDVIGGRLMLNDCSVALSSSRAACTFINLIDLLMATSLCTWATYSRRD